MYETTCDKDRKIPSTGMWILKLYFVQTPEGMSAWQGWQSRARSFPSPVPQNRNTVFLKSEVSRVFGPTVHSRTKIIL
jgi:hypothetical protein